MLGESRQGLKMVYATDTRPLEELVTYGSHADLYIGEGMYGDPEKIEKANLNKHSTIQETAILAKQDDGKRIMVYTLFSIYQRSIGIRNSHKTNLPTGNHSCRWTKKGTSICGLKGNKMSVYHIVINPAGLVAGRMNVGILSKKNSIQLVLIMKYIFQLSNMVLRKSCKN